MILFVDDLKKLLDDSGVTTVFRGTTTEDFDMPSRSALSRHSTFRLQHPIEPVHRPLTRAKNSVASETVHVQQLRVLDTMKRLAGRSAVTDSEVDIGSKHQGILDAKVKITVSNLRIADVTEAAIREGDSEEDGNGNITDETDLNIPETLALGKVHTASNVRPNRPGLTTWEPSTEYDVFMSLPEDHTMQIIKANFESNIAVTRQQLASQDLKKIYKDTAVTGAEKVRREVPDPVNQTPVKHDKWTYDLLTESKTFAFFLIEVVHTFESYFERFYTSVTERHDIEWCILVDNSGSMISKEIQMTEALVLAMETLKRMEFQFAVARFGDRNSQQMLKNLGDRFDSVTGQRIIESFSFDQGTYPATALANVAAKVWPSVLERKQTQGPQSHANGCRWPDTREESERLPGRLPGKGYRPRGFKPEGQSSERSDEPDRASWKKLVATTRFWISPMSISCRRTWSTC